MTSLSDALNSSAPMFDQVQVVANWLELPPGYTVNANAMDSLEDLGSQVGPTGYTVVHGFDDGLPDAVTMTKTNDGSGSLAMDLIGRPPNIADVADVRVSSSGTGTGTSVAIPNPTGVVFGDYEIIAIALNNLNDVTDADFDLSNAYGWTLLASQADVSVKLWVFGRPFYTGMPGLNLTFASASYSWVSASFYAYTYSGTLVDVRPGTPVGFAETVSQTTHTIPAQELTARGWTLGIFAAPSAGGVWSAGSGNTEIVERDSTTNIMLERSALLRGDSRAMVATSASATSVVAGIGIPLMIMDRQLMDAVAYFSPFNEDSPIVGFERDTAPLRAAVAVVTATGVVATDIFKGQMADITLANGVGNLTGVSATRLALDKALTLPTVFGRREGCTVDWLVSYLGAQGGQYAGVAPSTKTRLMIPMHGSVHPFNDGPLGYEAVFVWDVARSPTGPYGVSYPAVVEGPFQSAMFFQQTDALTQEWQYLPDRVLPAPPGVDDPEMNDLLSQQNSAGRWTFWIRGDAAQVAPASLAGAADDLLVFGMYNDQGPGIGNLVKVFIGSDRQIRFTMDGVTVAMTGGVIPTDGDWHFVGLNWDYVARKVQGRMDSTFWDAPTGWGAGTALPTLDKDWRDQGHFVQHSYRSRLPIAEIQLETGTGLAQVPFTPFWPTPLAPSLNMLTRPTYQYIEDIAEPAPLQGWTVLQELALATASWFRINESDNLQFLPLEYFGEDAQLTPTDVMLDTAVNTGDLAVTSDPTLTRNSVTVQFQEERVDSNRAPVLDVSAPIQIPRGITTILFALDVPTCEIHGASNPYLGSTWDITKLNTSQIDGLSPLPNEHFMSVNPLQDGSATTSLSALFTARIVAWDNSTVTITFTNRSSGAWWLANDGQQVPFLRILGYQVRSATAYSTNSDPGSVAKRRERALATTVAWVNSRGVAAALSARLLAVLSQPRAQVVVRVMGDPTRVPGQLINLLDAEGTRVDGTWRILSCSHVGNGPQYTQDLQLLRVPDVLIWDEGTWDDYVWGA